MRIVYVCAVLNLALYIFFNQWGFHRGYRSGYHAAQSRYERTIADRVESQVRDTRRVMEIREKSAFKRGFDQCQEQF